MENLNKTRDSEERKCWRNSKQTLCNASLLINSQSQECFLISEKHERHRENVSDLKPAKL